MYHVPEAPGAVEAKAARNLKAAAEDPRTDSDSESESEARRNRCAADSSLSMPVAAEPDNEPRADVVICLTRREVGEVCVPVCQCACVFVNATGSADRHGVCQCVDEQ